MLNAQDIAALEALQKQGRPDKIFHAYIRKLTESLIFNGLIIFAIFLNAFFMALETDPTLETQHRDMFKMLDIVFLAIYTVEFMLKLYAEPINYWKSYYNLFDSAVLLISWVQSGISWGNVDADNRISVLRVLRAMRTLRTLRTVSFIRGLQVLVTALLDTLRKWVINIIILLLLIMFLFAIMGYYCFGYRDDQDKENWGTLARALLTLFSFVTVDGWTDLQQKLDELSMASRAYTMSFIFLGHFIFSNVFIGVIIINISEATESYKMELRKEREAVVRHKKEFMMVRQHNEVKQMLERQKKGAFSNFAEMVRSFERGLRHPDSNLVSDLCTNILWLETFMNSLDHADNIMFRTQQLQFEIADIYFSYFEERIKRKKRKKAGLTT